MGCVRGRSGAGVKGRGWFEVVFLTSPRIVPVRDQYGCERHCGHLRYRFCMLFDPESSQSSYGTWVQV
ncbi:hypothetical protein F511_24080 [Dorcoceras hygrometricum]|uniref:Uncharacterized protein n=1 Tax=Dorcoceras hygrometricum TaxID=472368 RepID=A0A2Z7BKI6_9LAMI|nr:hypothetical protein F511_24080 [Dorcoceras hygrometricum]